MEIKIRVSSKCHKIADYGQHDETHVDEYTMSSKKQCKAILHELLDAPAKKLTTKQIMQDFSSSVFSEQLDVKTANKIKNYYNGRLALMKEIFSELGIIENGTIEHEIPEECISFPSDDFLENSQNCSKLTIEVNKF